MIVVFGATGFTGKLTVDALVERGLQVRLAGRSPEKLNALADRHGGLEWKLADVNDPDSLIDACQGASVLITTVGPYTWWGDAAVEAAIRVGIPYFDATGEPAFIRRVFEHYSAKAKQRGVPLLTAIGYDYVPGTLAGGLALTQAGPSATQVNIGYFLSGPIERSNNSLSSGTLSSLRASTTQAQFAWRGGKLVTEQGAARVLNFDLENSRCSAVSIGSSEHLTLPRSFPQLEDVNVGLGWFAQTTKLVKFAGAASQFAQRVPAAKSLLDKFSRRESGDSDGGGRGPEKNRRDLIRTRVVAIARDGAGNELERVDLEGPHPYDLTGSLLAWSGAQALKGMLSGTGALGPIEAFGLKELEVGCAEAGLRQIQ